MLFVCLYHWGRGVLSCLWTIILVFASGLTSGLQGSVNVLQVLYCWCHSDSASVLLYFTMIIIVIVSVEYFIRQHKIVVHFLLPFFALLLVQCQLIAMNTGDNSYWRVMNAGRNRIFESQSLFYYKCVRFKIYFYHSFHYVCSGTKRQIDCFTVTIIALYTLNIKK